MKLLFDENLSRHLVTRLASAFPGSAHVTGVVPRQATDREVWEYARAHDFVVVSKDSDFNDLAFINGPPPKVIWLRVGNASTDQIGELLDTATDIVSTFEANEQDAVLVLRLVPGSADNDAR